MIKLIAKPLALLKAMWVLVFPMFGGSDPARADNSAGRWLGRALLVGAFLVLLTLINWSPTIGLSHVINSPTIPRLSDYWLPVLALCLYTLLWVGWRLYLMLTQPAELASSPFPDIDAAWNQALRALVQAEIAPEGPPWFLVLGWPSSTEDDLFRAAGVTGPVRQVPTDPGEPLHVTATRDGIWLTCPGASLSGHYRRLMGGLGGPDELPDPMKVDPQTLETLAEDAQWREWVRPDLPSGEQERARRPDRDLDAMKAGPSALETLAEDARWRERVKQYMESSQGLRGPIRVATPELHLSRLRHLCRLIIGDRRGSCPVRGMLLVLPIETASRGDRDKIAGVCREDLAAAIEVLPARCPVLVMICGLEQLPGFAELLERMRQTRDEQTIPERYAEVPGVQPIGVRMGRRFPLVHELTGTELPGMIEGSVEWVAASRFPALVHEMFEVESPGGEAPEEVLRINSRLFRFLEAIIDRAEPLARLVKESLPGRQAEPLLFGGCYFAGTGHDPATEQAFAFGVLDRMIKDRDSVTWTGEVLRKDAAALRRAILLKLTFLLIIALIALSAAGLIAKRWAHLSFQRAVAVRGH
jgi:hypothetical protein